MAQIDLTPTHTSPTSETPNSTLPPPRKRALASANMARLTVHLQLMAATNATMTATNTAMAATTRTTNMTHTTTNSNVVNYAHTATRTTMNGLATTQHQTTTFPPTPPPESVALETASAGQGPTYNFNAVTTGAHGILNGSGFPSRQGTSPYMMSSNPPNPRTVVRQGDWW